MAAWIICSLSSKRFSAAGTAQFAEPRRQQIEREADWQALPRAFALWAADAAAARSVVGVLGLRYAGGPRRARWRTM
jgi:hypothetical protein